MTDSFSGRYAVTKTSSNDEARNAYGWFNIATRDGADVVDAHGDQIHVDDLEIAAHEFVKDARVSGVEHDGGEPDGELISSIVFTDDVIQAIATDPQTGLVNDELHTVMKRHIPRGWFGAFHIADPMAWEQTKNGKSAFSIEGWAEEAETV
jgi:hypothetical protein